MGKEVQCESTENPHPSRMEMTNASVTIKNSNFQKSPIVVQAEKRAYFAILSQLFGFHQ